MRMLVDVYLCCALKVKMESGSTEVEFQRKVSKEHVISVVIMALGSRIAK